MVVVGMAVIGIAILYSTFYVWLGVDLPGSMKVTECMLSIPFCKYLFFFNITSIAYYLLLQVGLLLLRW